MKYFVIADVFRGTIFSRVQPLDQEVNFVIPALQNVDQKVNAVFDRIPGGKKIPVKYRQIIAGTVTLSAAFGLGYITGKTKRAITDALNFINQVDNIIIKTLRTKGIEFYPSTMLGGKIKNTKEIVLGMPLYQKLFIIFTQGPSGYVRILEERFLYGNVRAHNLAF